MDNTVIEKSNLPFYKAEISTNAKGQHQFLIKACGPDMEKVLSDAKAMATELNVFCIMKNEGVKA